MKNNLTISVRISHIPHYDSPYIDSITLKAVECPMPRVLVIEETTYMRTNTLIRESEAEDSRSSVFNWVASYKSIGE